MDKDTSTWQAALLIALGEHLRTHGLAVHSVPFLDVVRAPDDAPGMLADWADSLGVRALVATPITGADWSALRFRTALAGVRVEVWAKVSGWPPDQCHPTPEELRAFTERCHLPRTGGGESDD